MIVQLLQGGDFGSEDIVKNKDDSSQGSEYREAECLLDVSITASEVWYLAN